MWYCVISKIVPNVSKERSALTFSAKHFLRLPDSKEEDTTTFRNVGSYTPNETVSHP